MVVDGAGYDSFVDLGLLGDGGQLSRTVCRELTEVRLKMAGAGMVPPRSRRFEAAFEGVEL